MKISLQQFGGIAPRVRPRYLPQELAQTSDNMDTKNMSIKPLPTLGSALVTLPKTGPIETLYRYGQDVTAANRPTQYWFHWAEDVDVCRSQISGDAAEWTFFTGESFAPRATNATLALTGGGTAYPIASKPLGLPAPSAALTAATDQTPPDPLAGDEVYAVYVYTYVYANGALTMESAPASASGQVFINADSTVTLNGFAALPGGDYTVTYRRFYRSEGGSYFAVPVTWSGNTTPTVDVPVAITTVYDAAEPGSFAEEMTVLDNYEPPATLRGLTNLSNGILAGFTGRDVYFSKPYMPYAWPVAYMQSLDYPIVGLGAIDTTLVVLTTGTPYFIQGSHPDSMVVVQTDMEQACVSKRSIVSMDGRVVYCSPDGIVSLSPNRSEILTLSTIDRATWQTYQPQNVRAFGHDRKYFALKDADGGIYDFDTGQFSIIQDIGCTAGFADIQDDALYLVNSSKQVVKWGGGSGVLTAKWKSKKFATPYPMSFALAQVLAEAYTGTITFKLYVDGVLSHTQTVTSNYQFRLPPDVGSTFEVEISTDMEVFAVNFAQSAEELATI